MIYLILINLVSFLLFGIDKGLAKAHRRRTPERTLFFISILGGSFGSLAGMYTFRHKTKHRTFTLGIPLILIIHFIIIIFLSMNR